MSLKFIYLKRHFTVQTEKVQAQLFTRVNVARPVYPNREPGMEVVLSLLSWVSVVSTSEPLPAKTPSSSSGWLQPDHQDSSAWRRRGKPLQLRELGTPFQSCVNALHEPENQQDAVMPSAASISDYVSQAGPVFPFKSCCWGLCVSVSSCLWCLRHTIRMRIGSTQAADSGVLFIQGSMWAQTGHWCFAFLLVQGWQMYCTEARCFQHSDIQAVHQHFKKCQFCHVWEVNWVCKRCAGPSLNSECGMQRARQHLHPPSPGTGREGVALGLNQPHFHLQQVKRELLVCHCAQGPSTVKSTYPEYKTYIFLLKALWRSSGVVP